jgi:hypothetical protein
MPELGTSDFELIKDSLVVVYINDKRCYGKRPGGLPCPVTNQFVEFEEIFDENGKRIDGFTLAVPLIDSSDTSKYETIGPDNPVAN